MNKWLFVGILALAIVMACAAGATAVKRWINPSSELQMLEDATAIPTDVATSTSVATATATSTSTATATATAVAAKAAPAKPAVKVVTKVVVATAVPAAVVQPTQPPQVEVDLKSLDLTAIINALSAKGMKVDSRQIFGDSWVTQSGPVKGTLPAGYNVLVLSSDAASFANNEVNFNSSPEGFLAIVVTNSPEFTIDNISYNSENQHRNVSGYALKINATGADLQNFALNLAAFEWSKEHKPYLFFSANGKVVKAAANVVKDINSEQELRTFISGLLK